MVKKWVTRLVLLIICLWLTDISAYGEDEKKKEYENFTLYAQSAVLLDADSGRVLYEKNGNVIRPMASTTKIMTSILALEQGNLEDEVSVSAYAAGQPKVHLGMRKGERYRLEDLLYSLMLESHNDTAAAIAEHIGGSVVGFAALMNQKARDLGCRDTWFITPNGLDAEESDQEGNKRLHSTTAIDLSRIMRYCIMESPKKEEFLKITRTGNYTFSDLDGKRTFSCTNHNALLSMMRGALSGKTGFTGGAGYSYVGALREGERTFVIALLGCGWPPHKTYKWSDSRQLLQYGMENYQYRDVYQEIELPEITVEDGALQGANLEELAVTGLSLRVPEGEKELPYLLREDEEVLIRTHLPEKLQAPIIKGDVVGSISYELQGNIIKTYPVYADATVEKRNFTWCFAYIWRLFL